MKVSTGLNACTSLAPPGGDGICQREACGWKLCQVLPTSRLNRYQRIVSPEFAVMIGVLPTKARPFRQKLALPPPPENTMCWLSPELVQMTSVPAVMLMSAGVNLLSSIFTFAAGPGAPATTRTRAAMLGPWMRQM